MNYPNNMLEWLSNFLVHIHTPTSPDMSGIRFTGQMRNWSRGGYFKVSHRTLEEAYEDWKMINVCI